MNPPHKLLLGRGLALFRNLIAYHAVHVPLDEALKTLLRTCDVKLVRAAGVGERTGFLRVV